MIDDLNIPSLVQELERIVPDPDRLDDEMGLYCCRLALDALEQGSYGVAALLLDPDGGIVAQAENRVFAVDNCHGYNSRAHAEMLLIDQLEAGELEVPPQQLTLMVSLEPCPMCLGRILLSGIGSVRYIAADPDGGMLRHISHFPPAWRNLAQLQNHYHAHVSPAIELMAEKLAAMNLPHLRHKLFTHIRP